MKLTSLAILVEHAQKLHDLGIKQVSCFYWYQEKVSNDQQLFKSDITQFMMPWKLSIGKPSKDNNNIYKELSAFTTSEIGEMLPTQMEGSSTNYYLTFHYSGKGWAYWYRNDDFSPMLCSSIAQSEQDARAKLLIAILENKYIDVSQTIIK